MIYYLHPAECIHRARFFIHCFSLGIKHSELTASCLFPPEVPEVGSLVFPEILRKSADLRLDQIVWRVHTYDDRC